MKSLILILGLSLGLASAPMIAEAGAKKGKVTREVASEKKSKKKKKKAVKEKSSKKNKFASEGSKKDKKKKKKSKETKIAKASKMKKAKKKNSAVAAYKPPVVTDSSGSADMSSHMPAAHATASTSSAPAAVDHQEPTPSFQDFSSAASDADELDRALEEGTIPAH